MPMNSTPPSPSKNKTIYGVIFQNCHENKILRYVWLTSINSEKHPKNCPRFKKKINLKISANKNYHRHEMSVIQTNINILRFIFLQASILIYILQIWGHRQSQGDHFYRTHFLLTKVTNLATTNCQKRIGTIRALDPGVIRDFCLGGGIHPLP